MQDILKISKNRGKLLSDSELLDLAGKVVNHHVKNGSIPLKEKEDIQMGVVEKFLLKADSITAAFKGEAKLSTYYTAVLHKMCCELIRKNIKQWNQVPSEEIHLGESTAESTLERLVINDEIRLLKKILVLFAEESNKLRLFLAYYYQLVVLERDISRYDQDYIKNKLDTLFTQIDIKNKGEIFERLAIAVQRAEKKNIKSDAVRMWLNKSIDSIVERLNGPFNRAGYDKESMQILFEMYYSKRNSKPLNHKPYG
jgi:hypothetical protein